MNGWSESNSVFPGQRGFSHVEVLIAVVILAVALVPALTSLQTSILASDIHAEESTLHYRAYGRMEELLATAYPVLEAEALAVGDPAVPTSFSDAPATPDRRLVFLSLYDGDNADTDDDPFTGTDAGLVWLRVEIEGRNIAMQSLKSL